MKYKLVLRNTETLVEELIIKSDSIKTLVNHVRDNSIYKSKYENGFPFYVITLYNRVRREIVIGNNEISGINLTGTIRSRDDHRYDYVIQNVDPDDWFRYCCDIEELRKYDG